MARITAPHVPGRIARPLHRFAHALGHAALVVCVDLVVAQLGLPLEVHIAVGALIVLGIEAVARRRSR
ncbi:MAG: hypothetical protein ACLQRH_27305 [Acidimicrobiales bacterium]